MSQAFYAIKKLLAYSLGVLPIELAVLQSAGLYHANIALVIIRLHAADGACAKAFERNGCVLASQLRRSSANFGCMNLALNRNVKPDADRAFRS